MKDEKDIRTEENKRGAFYSILFVLFFLSVFALIYSNTRSRILSSIDEQQIIQMKQIEDKLEENSSRLEAHVVHISNIRMLPDYLTSRDDQLKAGFEDYFTKLLEYTPASNL